MEEAGLDTGTGEGGRDRGETSWDRGQVVTPFFWWGL